ncbi:MAG: SRPBCC domain-containing protein [Bacteroidota bacterium]|nr:SRPBCC domain-containing protein [Odoribacter sp.]MDP3643874.1 SRPBCC domain-containing protein [Bacteroidota bacterium]
MAGEAFVIERTFEVATDRIWKAITDKDEMKLWYFDLPEFRPEVGFTFRFTGGPAEDRQYLHICKITEVIPDKKLAYTWKYEGYEGNTRVTFELFEEGKQSRLKLRHEGLKTFPASNPDFAEENFAEGWTWIIGTALKEFLEKSINEI